MVELVEPAKPTALEKLGEAEPALEVAVGWPRPKCDGAPSKCRNTHHHDRMVAGKRLQWAVISEPFHAAGQ